MSLLALRATVSFLTLNSLLQIYENQPVEFWDSNQMMSHPKLTPIFQSNQYLNLLAGFFTLTLIDTSNKFQFVNSIVIATSVIIQNLNLFLPKTFNMISIYFQLIVLVSQLFVLFSSYYEKQQFNKIPQPHSSIQFQESIKEQKTIKKQTQKKQISHKKKEKVQQQQLQSTQEPQIEKIEQPDNTEVESIENDFNEFMKQPSNDQTILISFYIFILLQSLLQLIIMIKFNYYNVSQKQKQKIYMKLIMLTCLKFHKLKKIQN